MSFMISAVQHCPKNNLPLGISFRLVLRSLLGFVLTERWRLVQSSGTEWQPYVSEQKVYRMPVDVLTNMGQTWGSVCACSSQFSLTCRVSCWHLGGIYTPCSGRGWHFEKLQQAPNLSLFTMHRMARYGHASTVCVFMFVLCVVHTIWSLIN